MALQDTYEEILGRPFVDFLNEPIIVLGSLKVTRQALARSLGLYSTISARNFVRVCRDLQINSIEDLKNTSALAFADATRCGPGTMNVAIQLLRATGHSIGQWYRQSFERDAETVTFQTLKRHAFKRNEEAEKDKRHTTARTRPALAADKRR